MKVRQIPGHFKFRLLATTLLIVALAFTIGLFVIYKLVINMMQSENEQSTIAGFSKVENSINLLLDNAMSISLSLQVSDSIESFLESDNKSFIEKVDDKLTLMREIDDFVATYDYINAIIVFTNDGRTGGSSRLRGYFYQTDLHPFFSSNEYSNAIKRSGQTVWTTKYTHFYFAQTKPKNPITRNDICISGIRYAGNVVGKRDTGFVLLVSIKEPSLRQFYEQLNEGHSSIVMLDSDGVQFSGTSMDGYGMEPPYFSLIDKDKNYGSFEHNSEENKYQIIYYRLEATGWWLVKLMPYRIYQKNASSISFSMVLIAIGTLLAISVIYTFWIFRLTRPIESLVKTMNQTGGGDLQCRADTNSGIYEFDRMSTAYNAMLDDINNLINENQIIEREKLNLEIRALQNQIRPHFIYNTITSIRWMASLSGADNVAEALIVLIKLLRPVFGSQELIWPLDKEFEFVKNYLFLMEIRYGSDIVFTIHNESANHTDPYDILSKWNVPRFLLQPIVENCFEHAFEQGKPLKIDISTECNDDYIAIAVEDNGKGMDSYRMDYLNNMLANGGGESQNDMESDDHSGIGLINTNRRLELSSGRSSRLSLENGNSGGVRVNIYIHQ